LENKKKRLLFVGENRKVKNGGDDRENKNRE